MKLSYEDAMFYKLILQGGYHKEVNDWIDNVSENNDLLEGIYLDIVSNQENLNELISCLHNYVVVSTHKAAHLAIKLKNGFTYGIISLYKPLEVKYKLEQIIKETKEIE